MNNKLLLIFLYFLVINSEIKAEYAWPTNASKTLTTVFGEERSRRFHAGIDVRTYGQIGNPIYAIETGYISRIKVSPEGYGNTLYLKLNDGNTAVYAHLDEFEKSIEEKVQYIKQTNSTSYIDSFLKKNEIKFEKGAIIGYTGDTGTISGPHLHFEIRDKNGKPLNPLKSFYSIEDTLNPVAKSVAFIPLDKNCWINGTQDYSIFNLEKTNEYKYVILDTISVIGNFGIAIEVDDKINNQPFNFNIYNIELLINNKLLYKIQFDEYDFNQDFLIYKEIDFNLLTELSKEYHRLYINNNHDLDFIDPLSSSGYNIDENLHYLVINISDINNNKIQIQGILKGDILVTKPLKLDSENLQLFSENGFDGLNFNYTTRYSGSTPIPASYSQLDFNTLQLDMPEKPYNTLEYFQKDSSGIKSKKHYINLEQFDPYKINGKVNIKYFDKGACIQFVENIFTGFNATAYIKTDNKEQKIELYRSKKNVLTSQIMDFKQFNNIKNITIIYDSNPKIVIEKPISGNIFKANESNNYSYKSYSLIDKGESLYNDILITFEDTLFNIGDNFEVLENPIKIHPFNIPFKNSIILSYNKNKLKGAIYNYSREKKKWYYMKKGLLDNINTTLYSGGIFAILNEKVKPEIKNITPSFGATYKSKDIKEISFNIKDQHSGINHNNIVIKINNEVQYHEYIPYRNLVRTKIPNKLDKGKHQIEIYSEDRLGNSIYKKGIFYIK